VCCTAAAVSHAELRRDVIRDVINSLGWTVNKRANQNAALTTFSQRHHTCEAGDQLMQVGRAYVITQLLVNALRSKVVVLS